MGNHAVFQLTEQAVADGWNGGVIAVTDAAELNVAEALAAGGGVITLDLDAPDGLQALSQLDAYPALERVEETPAPGVPSTSLAPSALVVAEPPPEAIHAAEREREARENAELAALEAEQAAEDRAAKVEAERQAFIEQRQRDRAASTTVSALVDGDPSTTDTSGE